MKIRCGAASVAKRGNSAEENEDAFAPAMDGASIPLPVSFAVSDGATEASYSALWARLIVESFCGLEDPNVFEQTLPSLRERWRSIVGSKPLPWYAEQKLSKGSFATLAGVRIEEHAPGAYRWRGIAQGDSVIFHVRDLEPIAIFPSLCSDDFKERPTLISTNPPEASTDNEDGFLRTGADFLLGDQIFIASDKISEWVIRAHENGQRPFAALDQVSRTQNSFPSWIESLVALNELRNDDHTLLWAQAID